jgi:hypothetical protein
MATRAPSLSRFFMVMDQMIFQGRIASAISMTPENTGRDHCHVSLRFLNEISGTYQQRRYYSTGQHRPGSTSRA